MTITVSAPDGSTIDFPAGTSDSVINQVMQQNFAAQQPGIGEDLLASAKSAPGRAIAGLAGIPGDLLHLGTQALGDNLTQRSEFGSEAIRQALGSDYQAKTFPGKVLQTAADFAPAVVGGPEALGAKLLTRVAVPALASETAGALTEGTGLEPVARVGAALGSAAGASKFMASRAAASAAPAVAGADAIQNAKTSLYNSQEVKDLRIAPQAVEKVVDRITDNLKREYIDAPQTFKQLELLKTPMNGPSFSIMDLENGRRRLNDLKALGGAEGLAAQRATNYLDMMAPHWGKLPGAVVAGDARAAATNLQLARQNAAVQFRAELVDDFLKKATNTALATHSGGNLENEIYKQVRTALNNPGKHLKGWNEAEKKALQEVLPGLATSLLRRGGKILGGGGGLGQVASGAAGATMFGPVGAIAMPALGLGANKLGSALAQNRLEKVGELLRSRAPLTGGGNVQAQRQALLSQKAFQNLPPKQQLALAGLLSLRPAASISGA